MGGSDEWVPQLVPKCCAESLNATDGVARWVELGWCKSCWPVRVGVDEQAGGWVGGSFGGWVVERISEQVSGLRLSDAQQ